MVYYPINDSEKAKKGWSRKSVYDTVRWILKKHKQSINKQFEYKALFVGLEVQKRIVEIINKFRIKTTYSKYLSKNSCLKLEIMIVSVKLKKSRLLKKCSLFLRQKY